MKVLVSFQPNKNEDNFEGTRLRKSIKGSLELSGVTYTSNPIDYFDVAHFIGVRDEKKIDEAIENNQAVVISCLGCEEDVNASILDVKIDRKGNRIFKLSSKALRVLNKATLILVPNQLSKDFLIKEGVEKTIEITSPGVNLARFDFSRNDEKDIFYRYYREDKNKPLVVAVGRYSNTNGITTFINAAKKCPNALFYYFGPNLKKAPLRIKSLIKSVPKNVKFKNIPTDDIYRSALINASVFVYPGYGLIGVVTLLEAIAARCQIVVREQPIFEDIIIDGVNSYSGKYSETLTSVIKDCLEGKIASTVEKAYKYVQDFTLEKIGEKLKINYQQALNIK